MTTELLRPKNKIKMIMTAMMTTIIAFV